MPTENMAFSGDEGSGSGMKTAKDEKLPKGCKRRRRRKKDSDATNYSSDYLQSYVAKNYGYDYQKEANPYSYYGTDYLTGYKSSVPQTPYQIPYQFPNQIPNQTPNQAPNQTSYQAGYQTGYEYYSTYMPSESNEPRRSLSRVPSYLKTDQIIVKKIEEKYGTRKITIKRIRENSKNITNQSNEMNKSSERLKKVQIKKLSSELVRTVDSEENKLFYTGYEGPLKPRVQYEPSVPDEVAVEIEKRAPMEKPFKSTVVFEKSDQQALDLSKEIQKSVKELITKLFPAYVSELTIARKIFIWLCSKDLGKFDFEGVGENTDTPENVLLKLKKGLTTYAVVYSTLCKEAGLMCKTIVGYAKGANYVPGMKFNKTQCQHSWNAVFVDGVWRLVDCHWAARRLVGKQSANWDRIKYDLDEYYFMPNPSQLIFTHFPEENCWQLIDNPVTLEQFENLVAVKSAFFKYGLEILSHVDAVIYFDETVQIEIGTTGQELQFQNTLNKEDRKKTTRIERCCMHSVSSEVVRFFVRPLEVGTYHFTIFAREENIEKDKLYNEVCEYSLECKSISKGVKRFPPAYRPIWGASNKFSRYGLGVKHKEIIQNTTKGTLDLRYTINRPLRFLAELMTEDWNDKELSKYVLTRLCDDTAIFTVKPPVTGEFTLNIYANDPIKEGNELTHIYQYLVVCNSISDPPPVPMPILPAGFLSAQPAYYNTPVKALSTTDPYIVLYKQQTTMLFTTDDKTVLTWELFSSSDENPKEYHSYIFQMSKDNIITLLINLPVTPHIYKLLIFSGDRPHKDDKEIRFKSIFNYLIECRAKDDGKEIYPFPTQLDSWGEGMKLLEPFYINQSGDVKFSLIIPEAKAVAVVMASLKWNHLKKVGDNWTSSVCIDSIRDTLTVCAKFKGVSSKYTALLEYKGRE
ncbi:DgyrCDS4427 [Dimorphilus gyrociliatus]|uniref:DgyrCDS4427 n=1 Tax=Dimorphilus gyrociliatus TaxID=2664684 RepID=A0A7I8VGM5_9ANNE|nr:DgyrCDS4427 [Dimorphilus gyrociliatus]